MVATPLHDMHLPFTEQKVLLRLSEPLQPTHTALGTGSTELPCGPDVLSVPSAALHHCFWSTGVVRPMVGWLGLGAGSTSGSRDRWTFFTHKAEHGIAYRLGGPVDVERVVVPLVPGANGSGALVGLSEAATPPPPPNPFTAYLARGIAQLQWRHQPGSRFSG